MNRRSRIRHVTAGDWPAVAALESRAYAPLGLSEERAALESRARVSPHTCFVLHTGPRLAGYLLALPYPGGRYPDLARAERTAFRSANLHLHDLVVAEDLRGRGHGRRLVRHLTTVAGEFGYQRISLVAVAGSRAFWTANGFTAHDAVAAAEGYGPDSVYMSKAVRAAPGDAWGRPAGSAPPGSPSHDEAD